MWWWIVSLHLLAAYFSVGHAHPDEHFQILEIAWSRVGLALDHSAVPWEFQSQIRGGLAPWIAAIAMRVWPESPELIALFLRVLASLLGVLALFSLWRGWRLQGREAGWIFSFTWFLPYLHARFSSESIAGSLFWIAIGWIGPEPRSHRWQTWLTVGVLLGLATQFRYQCGFLVLGFLFWVGFHFQSRLRVLLATVFGIALATALGAWADHWLYGEWRPVAWNFFRVNLLEGKAAEFGVSPWWEYFRLLATQLMAPPWGILWLVVAALGFFQSKARPLLFSITPFFLIHCLISHKEFRFLYPLAGVLPLLLVLGSERFSLKSRMPWIRRWALGSWAKGANLLLLALFCLKPARYFTAVHLEIQRLSRQGPLCVYTADGLPAFFEHGIPMNFYRPSSVRTFQLPEGQEAEACRKLLYFRGYSDPGAIQRRYPGAKCIYRAFPEWLVQFNPFRWLERAQGAELWEILNTGGISKREE